MPITSAAHGFRLLGRFSSSGRPPCRPPVPTLHKSPTDTMSLATIATETLQILDAGGYTNSRGERVEFGSAQQLAVEGTSLYTPDVTLGLLTASHTVSASPPRYEVTDETTQLAARRLVEIEDCNDVVLLNYASALKPGGGFISGMKSQEEDLARCSGLYPCLLTEPDYYAANRSEVSLLYTDHIIYSPRVPWFRVESNELLNNYFLASIITAPAPNAGEALARDSEAGRDIVETLRRRSGMVLAVARDRGHRTLILGAWGCGVFRNDPVVVADAFGQWLEGDMFMGSFDRVVFAVYDKSYERSTLRAFEERFR